MSAQKKSNIFVRGIDYLFALREKRQPVKVKRSTYLLVALFLGWCGGHRFMSKQYGLFILYLVLFWTGFPIAMTIIDLLIVIPIKADDDGYILI